MAKIRVGVSEIPPIAQGQPAGAVGAHWIEVDGVRVGGDSLLAVEFSTSGGEVSTVTCRFLASAFETAPADTPPTTDRLAEAMDALVELEQEVWAEHDGSDRELRTVATAKTLIGCCLRTGHDPLSGHQGGGIFDGYENWLDDLCQVLDGETDHPNVNVNAAAGRLRNGLRRALD